MIFKRARKTNSNKSETNVNLDVTKWKKMFGMQNSNDNQKWSISKETHMQIPPLLKRSFVISLDSNWFEKMERRKCNSVKKEYGTV